MKKRSKAWIRQRSKLDSKELKVKKDLETASNDFESQVKRVAVISLVSGVAVLGAYTLFKAMSRKEEIVPEPKKTVIAQAPIPTPIKPKGLGFTIRNMVMERAAMIALNFIGAQLTVLLAKKFGDKEEDED